MHKPSPNGPEIHDSAYEQWHRPTQDFGQFILEAQYASNKGHVAGRQRSPTANRRSVKNPIEKVPPRSSMHIRDTVLLSRTSLD